MAGAPGDIGIAIASLRSATGPLCPCSEGHEGLRMSIYAPRKRDPQTRKKMEVKTCCILSRGRDSRCWDRGASPRRAGRGRGSFPTCPTVFTGEMLPNKENLKWSCCPMTSQLLQPRIWHLQWLQAGLVRDGDKRPRARGLLRCAGAGVKCLSQELL